MLTQAYGIRPAGTLQRSDPGAQPAAVIIRIRSLRARWTWLRAVASGNAEDLANLVKRQALFVAEHDGRPLVRPQRGQRLSDGPAERAPLDRIGSGRRLEQVRALDRVDLDRERPGPAQRVDAGVVRDAEQPAGEPAPGIEGGRDSGTP